VRKFFGLASLVNNILKDLVHGDHGDSEVNSKALGKLILEDVGRTEENDLGVLGPAANEATVLIKETLL
jgi:hypothetical protein